MRLLTPKRLKENEGFMWGLADRQLDEFLANGNCEFIGAYAQPFAMLVVADLLGVPETEHERFRQGFGLSGNPGALGHDQSEMAANALGWLDDYFATYIEDRRRDPLGDVLTDLALAKYPDGSTPEVTAVVRTATFLFAAGQETTARLLATALEVPLRAPRAPRRAARAPRAHPGLHRGGAAHREPREGGLPSGPTGGNGRRRRDRTWDAGHAAERRREPRPRRFECPAEFRLGRANTREHIAFGRGAHSCPGGPLARAEARISIERILDRTRDIRLSEEYHGPAAARRFDYEPTWVLRGLHALHIEFTPAGPGG